LNCPSSERPAIPFTVSPPRAGGGSPRGHRGRGDDRGMGDLLVAVAIVVFVAAMLGLAWALDRI
jgi:hypothetical protein